MTRIAAKRYLLAHAEVIDCPVCATPVLLQGFPSLCRCGAFVYVNREQKGVERGWDWLSQEQLQGYFWWHKATGSWLACSK